MFVAHMSFHAQISDPSIGGTYMTLLNTLSNLGKLLRNQVSRVTPHNKIRGPFIDRLREEHF